MCDAHANSHVRCLDLAEVSPEGLEKREVAGDGNCFWHSLALLMKAKWRVLKQESLRDLDEAEVKVLATQMCITLARLKAQVIELRSSGRYATTLAISLAVLRLQINIVIWRPQGPSYMFSPAEESAETHVVELAHDHFTPMLQTHGIDVPSGEYVSNLPSLSGGASNPRKSWEQHKEQHAGLRIMTWNINSTNTHMLRAMSICSDVLCLIETRHTRESKPTLDKIAQSRGWHGCWGQDHADGYPKAGVALFSRLGRPVQLELTQELEKYAEEGHLMVAACPARGIDCPITIACVYGYTSNKTLTFSQAKQRTRDLLYQLNDFMSQFMNQGMCMMGDFNLPPEDSALQWITRNGMWRHAVHEFYDVPAEMTCFAGSNASCIDHIFIGQKMAHLQCDGFVLDGGGIRPHCAVGAEFSLQQERVTSVSLPPPLPNEEALRDRLGFAHLLMQEGHTQLATLSDKQRKRLGFERDHTLQFCVDCLNKNLAELRRLEASANKRKWKALLNTSPYKTAFSSLKKGRPSPIAMLREADGTVSGPGGLLRVLENAWSSISQTSAVKDEE
eukprot:2845550-Amphidinium_carterae.1